jgi:hypothetical protein
MRIGGIGTLVLKGNEGFKPDRAWRVKDELCYVIRIGAA